MSRPPRSRPNSGELFHELAEEDTKATVGFRPSFANMFTQKSHMSKHEREWIIAYLGGFHDDHLIDDVLRCVKGGKEATVYCCKAGPALDAQLVAGKVYHERMFRSLKNDAVYREGRVVRDDEGKGVRGRREGLAMRKKTSFGQELRHVSWLTTEFRVLSRLYEAGADVPRPYAQNDNAILMEYVGDEGAGAPALSQIALRKGEARPLFDRLVHNVELMLANECVHADLSAYNVLYWEGEAKIIDFPQAVDPYVNPQAFSLFERDVKRLCQYFARYGVEADASELARSIWARHIVT